jgi:hypothetical protein
MSSSPPTAIGRHAVSIYLYAAEEAGAGAEAEAARPPMAEAVNGWNHRIRLRREGKRAGGIDGTATAAAFASLVSLAACLGPAAKESAAERKGIESTDGERDETTCCSGRLVMIEMVG